jgi:AcrR family transcriptional regulator
MPQAATPPIAEAASTRDAILDAGERRFAEHGFAGASVREIASDVGLRNQASLYHYFRSKEALYEAVIDRAVDALVHLWQPADLSARATEDDLDRVFDYLIAHPHVARLIERAGIDEDHFVRGASARLLRPLYEAGLNVLARAAAPWPPDELPHLAAGLYHLIFGYFANAALLQGVMSEDPYSTAMLERQRRFLKTALLRLGGAGGFA